MSPGPFPIRKIVIRIAGEKFRLVSLFRNELPAYLFCSNSCVEFIFSAL